MDSYSNELLWFVVGLVLMLGEIITPGFVLIFFGIGAWVIALLLWFGAPVTFTSQLFLFLVVSVTSLVLFRKYGKKYSHGAITKADSASPVDDIRGERAVATSDISPTTGGSVEFHGTHWNAVSDTPVTKGASVEVLSRDNLTLKVQPIAERQ